MKREHEDPLSSEEFQVHKTTHLRDMLLLAFSSLVFLCPFLHKYIPLSGRSFKSEGLPQCRFTNEAYTKARKAN